MLDPVALAACGQAGNLYSGNLLGLRYVKRSLQAQPELRLRFEPVGQPQRRISCDGALTIDNLAYAIGRHGYLARQLSRRDAKGVKLLSKNLAWMNGRTCHWAALPASCGT